MAIKLPASADFVAAVDRVLELGDEGREALANWLAQFVEQQPSAAIELGDIKPLATQIDIGNRDAALTASALHYLLGLTYCEGAGDDEMRNALEAVGISPESAAYVTALAAQRPTLTESIGRAQRTAEYCRSGAKTVQSVALVCDMRAIWNTDADDPLEGTTNATEGDFVGWAPVVLMEVALGSGPFTPDVVSFQFTREEFGSFAKLVDKTSRRLEAAVEKVGGGL